MNPGEMIESGRNLDDPEVMAKPKACPFCEGNAKLRDDDIDRQNDYRCSKCGANGPWELFIANWEDRPIEDRLRHELDELQVACSKYKQAADELSGISGQLAGFRDQPKVLAAENGWANREDVVASFTKDREQLGPGAIQVTCIIVERKGGGA